jgi:hypothetical protein
MPRVVSLLKDASFVLARQSWSRPCEKHSLEVEDKRYFPQLVTQWLVSVFPQIGQQKS